MRRIAWLGTALVMMVAMVACGGGGGSSNSFSSGSSGSTGSTPPPAVSITSPQFLPSTVGGRSYSATLQASGGTAPYTWSAVTPFASWLTLDSKTGVVSGTVPQQSPAFFSQQYPLSIKVTDSATPPGSATATVYINVDGQITLANNPSFSATRGIPVSWTVIALGGHPPFTVSVDSGMPDGLQAASASSDNSYVSINGTPTATGNFSAKIRFKDSATTPQDVVLPVPINIDAKFTMLTSSLRFGVVGRTYSDQLQAVNGTAPLTWTATSVPSGLALDGSTGKVTGTPTSTLSSGMFVTVKDSSSPAQTIQGFISLTISPEMSFRPAAMTGNIGTFLSQGTFSGGGIAPVTVKMTSGTLPPGINFDSFGSVSGTPTQTGTYAFTVTATDSDTVPVVRTQSFTFSVFTSLPVLGDLSLPNAAVNKAYSTQIYAREGTLPYHWSVASGTLPAGLTLGDAGALTGTPTAAGQYSFQAKVRDSASPAQSASHSYNIFVATGARGRNDSIATATPLTSPFIQASLSPYSDPADSATSTPDSDYYSMSANAGAKVTMSVPSTNTVDPVIEILDANGQRYKTCRDVGDDNPTITFIVKDTTPNAFDDECLNDDIDPTVDRSASLQFLVPGATGTQLKFYVHVFDASGNARPDMTYTLTWSTTGP